MNRVGPADDDRVLIAGAGPVGLSCALFLTRSGIPVSVFEAESELPEDMRASTFHPGTLDVLEDADVVADLLANGLKCRQWQYRNHVTGACAVFDMEVLRGRTSHPYRLQCEQFRLTRAICSRLGDNRLFDLEFGARVIDATQNENGVEIEVERPAGPRTVRGSFVIGADGAGSRVRKAMGLDFRGETYPITSLTVAVRYPFDQHIEGLLSVNYCWTEDSHFSMMQLKDVWRVGFSPKPGQSHEEALQPERIQARLQEIHPKEGPYEIVHTGAYTIHRRIADSFRTGRMVLAGDAAHLNSPSGGLGMNSGIHDARSLCDKLAAIILDGADESLLDRYSRQRRSIALDDVQVRSDRNYRRHRVKGRKERAEVWDELQRVTGDRRLMTDFLMESSMLRSLEKAERID
ncbi:MAG: FAD-dependent monooxygenase [Gammaproteobacteria bacterium]|nr:FAD-dependent monooxygenase [Chromatiales bacterium]MYE49311.1 FAD-dependent monooxygenase [Gammaproteobacteria bacterium]